MATTQLSLYNGAMRHLGERKLSSTTEARLPARMCNDVWADDFIGLINEQADWSFAVRTVQIGIDPDVAIGFGYKNAFNIPDDFVRMSQISADEYFRDPLNEYRREGNLWFADVDYLYVAYVSNSVDFGGDVTNWSKAVVDYAEAELAWKICGKITQNSTKKKEISDERTKLLRKAKGLDGIQKPTVFPPQGNWSRARMGGGGLNRNRERG